MTRDIDLIDTILAKKMESGEGMGGMLMYDMR